MREDIENKIRDKLLEKLSIFGSGLKEAAAEVYLPNKLGTRGFVDILAIDHSGRHVIIELKRSKASSREALHESLKYIEGIKENKSLKNDEVIVYIVSTEWKELLIPFSSFVETCPYEVKGFQLDVDDDYNPTKATLIHPMILKNERKLSDIHAIRLYSTKERLLEGVQSHKDSFKVKGLDDYVLLILHAAKGFREFELDSVLETMNKIEEGNPKYSRVELSKMITEYPFIIYSVVQEMSESVYWNIIKNDQALWEEVRGCIEDCTKENVINILHDNAVESCSPLPFKERYEIAYPAKLRHKLLEDEEWEISEIIRAGKLKENTQLSDEELLDEIKGSSGTNKQTYRKRFSSENQASFPQMLKEVRSCLCDNIIWATGLEKAIDEVKILSKDKDIQGKVIVYSPSNTLVSIYRILSSSSEEEAMQYNPFYTLEIEGEVTRVYFGCLDYVDNKTSFEEILKQYYEGGNGLLLSLTWGGYQTNDVEICRSYGLAYSNYMVEENEFYKFDGFQYVRCDDVTPNDWLLQLANQNGNFLKDVFNFFNSRMF